MKGSKSTHCRNCGISTYVSRGYKGKKPLCSGCLRRTKIDEVPCEKLSDWIQEMIFGELDNYFLTRGKRVDKCIICLVEYDVNTMIQPCLCKYHSCETCMAEWLARNPSCPMCRKPMGEGFEREWDSHSYGSYGRESDDSESFDSGGFRPGDPWPEECTCGRDGFRRGCPICMECNWHMCRCGRYANCPVRVACYCGRNESCPIHEVCRCGEYENCPVCDWYDFC